MYDGTMTVTDPALIEDLGAPEGFRAYLLHDSDPGDSPRDWANVATLINEQSRNIDMDEDTEGIGEVRDFFSYRRRSGALDRREDMVRRYLRIFRPDIACYVGHWSYGRDGYGWGYVTREALAEAGFSQDDPDALSGTLAMRAEALLHAEVETYRQWAEGEVYGVIVVNESNGQEASLWGIYDDSLDNQYIEAAKDDLIEEVR